MKHLILTLILHIPLLTLAAQPASEAELLALEISGALLAPAALVQQIETDLALIRQHTPAVKDIQHLGRWQPGVLMVSLTEAAMEQYQSDKYHGLDDLNAKYGPVNISSTTFSK